MAPCRTPQICGSRRGQAPATAASGRRCSARSKASWIHPVFVRNAFAAGQPATATTICWSRCSRTAQGPGAGIAFSILAGAGVAATLRFRRESKGKQKQPPWTRPIQGSARRPYPRLRTVGQTGSKRTAVGSASGRSPDFPGTINHGLDTGMRARAEIPPISGKSHHQALRRGPVCSQDLSTTHSMGEHLSCRQRTRLPATVRS